MRKVDTHLIIDTDVGTDDLLAITLLHYFQNVKIHMICTALGVQTDPNTSMSCLMRMLKYLDPKNKKNVEFVIGDYRKKEHCFSEAHFFEGQTKFFNQFGKKFGLPKLSDDEEKELCRMAKSPNGKECVDRVIKLVKSKPKGYFTLLCIAPLSNISQLLKKDESIVKMFKQIVVMGGAIKESNVQEEILKNKKSIPECLEWNFYINPPGASSVFTILQKYKVDCFLIPIEASKCYQLTGKMKKEIIPKVSFKKKKNQIDSLNARIRKIVFGLSSYNIIALLYDSVSVCIFHFGQKFIQFEKSKVQVLTKRTGEKGEEGCSMISKTNKEKGINVGVIFDKKKYYALIKEILLE